MWRHSDFVRTPSQKTTSNQKTRSNVDLEMITWSENEVSACHLIRTDCFPVVVCLAHTLDDDVMTLNAGMALQVHGSIKSDLEVVISTNVDDIVNFVRDGNKRVSRPSSELPRFNSREISTIDEEEEYVELQTGFKVIPGDCGDGDDVLIVTTIDGGWSSDGEVLLLPSKLEPRFRLSSTSVMSSAPERSNGMVTGSSVIINTNGCLNKLASSHRLESSLEPLKDVPYLRRPKGATKSTHPPGDHLKNVSRIDLNQRICANEDQMKKSKNFETLPSHTSDCLTKPQPPLDEDGVRKIKSMLSLYDDVFIGRNSIVENSRASLEQPPISNSCANLNMSILSLLSSSNLSLCSSIPSSEFLNILRPMNYKRKTESVKPKSRFSIFRAKKAKKSKQIDPPPDARSFQYELDKTRRYVDLLDIVGKPKSSDCSVMGSILNLSDLDRLTSCLNLNDFSLVENNQTKHLSMPCDINKINGTNAFNHPGTSTKPLPLERYLINKPQLAPSDASIARKKQIKTNSRIQNKFGSQVLAMKSNDFNVEEYKRRVIYPEDFSKSVENVKCLQGFESNLDTDGQHCQRLGTSMIGVKKDSKTIAGLSEHDSSHLMDISENVSAHPHSVIRTNPHHLNRRKAKQQKNNLKLISKSTLSTDDDFQFVRLLSIRRTSDFDPIRCNKRRNNTNNNTNNNNSNNEVIYENINFTSDASPQDSLLPAKSLDSRTNSTESSDFINSDTSFGGANDTTPPHAKLVNEHRPTRGFNCPIKSIDDDGYQSSMDNFNVDYFNNIKNNYPFVKEVVSYL